MSISPRFCDRVKLIPNASKLFFRNVNSCQNKIINFNTNIFKATTNTLLQFIRKLRKALIKQHKVHIRPCHDLSNELFYFHADVLTEIIQALVYSKLALCAHDFLHNLIRISDSQAHNPICTNVQHHTVSLILHTSTAPCTPWAI